MCRGQKKIFREAPGGKINTRTAQTEPAFTISGKTGHSAPIQVVYAESWWSRNRNRHKLALTLRQEGRCEKQVG